MLRVRTLHEKERVTLDASKPADIIAFEAFETVMGSCALSSTACNGNSGHEPG